jgi:anti-anti-sigma factor
MAPDALHDNTGSMVIQKFGEKLDLTTTDALNDRCDPLYADERIRTIVFDLENVRYCDSYGLKFLIFAQRKAIAAQKRLVLYRPDTVLMDMFAATRLLQFFTITDKYIEC